MFSGIALQIKADGEQNAELEMDISIPATCFSQSVRQIDDKLVVEAVCGATSAKPAGISGEEIFDKDRTDSDIQALIVGGLSGSGVYIGDELIGLVSRSHKCILTECIESELVKAYQARDNAGIRAYSAMHPSAITHPLLNIHQIVTEESVATLLRSDASAR